MSNLVSFFFFLRGCVLESIDVNTLVFSGGGGDFMFILLLFLVISFSWQRETICSY